MVNKPPTADQLIGREMADILRGCTASLVADLASMYECSVDDLTVNVNTATFLQEANDQLVAGDDLRDVTDPLGFGARRHATVLQFGHDHRRLPRRGADPPPPGSRRPWSST